MTFWWENFLHSNENAVVLVVLDINNAGFFRGKYVFLGFYLSK